jgi:drug/metabolite transporter (DMT)-like permease
VIDDRERLAGVGCALGSAAAFGVTIVVQRELATRGLPVTTALGVRFGIAAVVLLVLLAATGQPVRPVPGERLRAALLGGVGYAVEAGLFYLALRRGSAGAVALLFYAYPAVVTLIEVALRTVPASLRTFGVLALSSTGAMLIVVSGGEVAISGGGVAYALAAAVSFACYLVASHRLIRRSRPGAIGAWVAGGASLALLTVGFAGPGVHVPAGDVWLLAVNGLATAAAFGMLYAALRRLTAAAASVVMTMEAFIAVGLGALLLHERVAPLQVAGGAAIVAAATLVATERRAPAAPPTP